MISSQELITDIQWGSIEVGSGEIFKDVILAPGLCIEWDWRKSGTSHGKGPQIADIDLLLSMGVDTIILSRGMELKLQISQGTFEYCLTKVKNVVIGESSYVVGIYNDLVGAGYRVGALIHSTC
jgi:hypothetical protein